MRRAVVAAVLALFLQPALLGAAAADGMVEDAVAPPAPADLSTPEDLLGVTWEWVSFGSGKEAFDVPDPGRYTIVFSADGSAAMQADCNRGTAQYEATADQSISFGPVATTRMLCPEGSLDVRFLAALEQVVIFSGFEGDLLLEAPADSGTLRFRRAAAD